jgi:hypothetical protein
VHAVPLPSHHQLRKHSGNGGGVRGAADPPLGRRQRRGVDEKLVRGGIERRGGLEGGDIGSVAELCHRKAAAAKKKKKKKKKGENVGEKKRGENVSTHKKKGRIEMILLFFFLFVFSLPSDGVKGQNSLSNPVVELLARGTSPDRTKEQPVLKIFRFRGEKKEKKNQKKI